MIVEFIKLIPLEAANRQSLVREHIGSLTELKNFNVLYLNPFSVVLVVIKNLCEFD